MIRRKTESNTSSLESRIDEQDSNAYNLLLTPSLLRPAPSNPDNHFMKSVTAVYQSLSMCTVLLSSIDTELSEHVADEDCRKSPHRMYRDITKKRVTANVKGNQFDSDVGANGVRVRIANTNASNSSTGVVDATNMLSSNMDDGIDYKSDEDLFEIDESEAPHVPLYTLRDEGSVKWAMLTDLCGMLKVKSKDTLIKQVSTSILNQINSTIYLVVSYFTFE